MSSQAQIEGLLREVDTRGRRNEWRLDALDEWRKKVVDPGLVQLDGMVKADEIAEAVAKKMSDGRRIRLTKVQMIFALLSLLAAWSAPVIALVAHTG